MGASKWFMHNGHNTGQKIQKSAIFSTYLPNLEALCTRLHEWAIGPLRQLPQPPAPILSKLKFFPTFLLFFTHCGMYDASFTLESCHWWEAYQMSPIMSNSMIVVSRGSKHSLWTINETLWVKPVVSRDPGLLGLFQYMMDNLLRSICCQNCNLYV